MEKLFLAAKVLQSGECLKDAATWKNRQLLMNVLLVIIGAIPAFLPIEMSQADINSISFGLATLGGVVNTYLTAATSKKVGL